MHRIMEDIERQPSNTDHQRMLETIRDLPELPTDVEQSAQPKLPGVEPSRGQPDIPDDNPPVGRDSSPQDRPDSE